MTHGYDRTRSHRRGARRRFLRVPALALVAVLTSAWLPCFACEGPSHGASGPELASPASCHGASEATASSCAPTIRAADSALNASAPPPAGFAVQPAFSASLLLPAAYRPAGLRLARRAPIHARPLYLLHESLLA
jgi:hypothetical protein